MKTTKRKFTTEFKEEAVRLVVHEGLSTPEAARRIEISDKTLANWVRLARHGKALSAGGGTERKASSVSELEMEVSKLRERAVEDGEGDFKKSDGVFREGVAMKYAAIDSMRQTYPLSILCDVLSVSTSGYHEWRDRPVCARQLANETLLSEIRVLHAQSFCAYGSPRIHASFKQRGRGIGRERIRRLMQENRIVGASPQEALPHDGLQPQATRGAEPAAAEL